MNLAVCLLAYGVILTVLGPEMLSRATRNGAAPRLGVTAWLTALGTVLLAWVGAVALFVTQLVVSWGQIGRTLTGCVVGLRLVVRGGYGEALQVGFVLFAALSVLALLVLGARVAVALRRSHLHTRNHAEAARIAAGDTPPGPGGALVIDSRRRGVYCLAGRPRTIVITRAALAALDDDQLGAVLAHERAHLTGRHHQLLALTGALRAILPGVRLFTEGATDIARLLEMCADDTAARRHSRDTVVDALLALTLPGPVAKSPAVALITPTAALSATGLEVTQRVERLLFPPDTTRARVHLTVALCGVLLGPIFIAGIMIVAPALCAI